jgi:hypothetical protein
LYSVSLALAEQLENVLANTCPRPAVNVRDVAATSCRALPSPRDCCNGS